MVRFVREEKQLTVCPRDLIRGGMPKNAYFSAFSDNCILPLSYLSIIKRVILNNRTFIPTFNAIKSDISPYSTV